jgi:hypothetical protein
MVPVARTLLGDGTERGVGDGDDSPHAPNATTIRTSRMACFLRARVSFDGG